MNDVAGAAPAAADSAPATVEGAPIAEVGANFTAPLGSQIPPAAVAKPAEPKAPASLDDSIDRAIAKSAAAKDKDVKASPSVAKEPVKEQPRENGKFIAKDAPKTPDAAPAVAAPKPAELPPKWIRTEEAEARADWEKIPQSIKDVSARREQEYEAGLQKHRAAAEQLRPAAERDGTLAEFHEMAQKSGTDVKTALQRYTALEGLLRKDPIKGLEEVFNNIGISPKDYAAHILGQTPEQNASQQDAVIRELKQELAGLKEQVGGVTQTFKQQQEQSTLTEINKFAADHTRFDELADDIAFFMQSGRAKDLPEAYQLAERLNPAPVQAADQQPQPLQIDPPVHPDKGQKSINGAPSSGLTSQSGKKRVALSLDESLDRAFGRTG